MKNRDGARYKQENWLIEKEQLLAGKELFQI